MSKPSPKKLARRQRKARTESRRNTEFKKRKQRLEAFPKWFLVPNEAPPEFVEAIDKVVRRIALEPELLNDFDNLRLDSPEYLKTLGINMKDLFLRATTEGFASPLWQVKQRLKETELELEPWTFELIWMHLLIVVFTHIPEKTVKKFTPFHLPTIEYARNGDDKAFTIKFESLQSAKQPGGTIFFSKRRPCVQLNDRRLVVAFTRHAAERVCERLGGELLSYPTSWDAFTYLNECSHFEAVNLEGEVRFAVFRECQHGTFYPRFVEAILGEYDPNCRYMVRLGYCPADEHGEYLFAKTFLFPGMRGTPEYEVIQACDEPPAGKRKLEEMARRLCIAEIARTQNIFLPRFFHKQGVPQVIKLR